MCFNLKLLLELLKVDTSTRVFLILDSENIWLLDILKKCVIFAVNVYCVRILSFWESFN